jgi:hypothetical protein
VSPGLIVPLVIIVELLAWAVGFVSGALWLMRRYERNRP